MDGRECLLKALANDGEPDRVPSFVEGMMDGFEEKTVDLYEEDITDDRVVLVEGDWTLFKFFGFDGVWLHSTPVQHVPLDGIDVFPEGTERMRLDRFGRVHRLSSEGKYKYQDGWLNSKERWQEWIDAGYFEITFDEGWVRRWEKAYPELLDEGLTMIPVTTCFEPVREAFNFGRFSHYYRKEMSFLKDLAARTTKNLLEVAKGWCDAGFEIVTWADDCAYKGRVMFPPRVFNELVAPIYKTLNDYCHKRGMLTFFHSDGFTEPFFEGLIASGFDGIQSLEPAAGMDLAHLKETWGSRVCLIGNLDCSRLLPYGTTGEVIEATKKCLRDAGEGGGYILGPTTDIIDSCKPENIMAMMDTLRKHGTYPLFNDAPGRA